MVGGGSALAGLAGDGPGIASGGAVVAGAAGRRGVVPDGVVVVVVVVVRGVGEDLTAEVSVPGEPTSKELALCSGIVVVVVVVGERTEEVLVGCDTTTILRVGPPDTQFSIPKAAMAITTTAAAPTQALRHDGNRQAPTKAGSTEAPACSSAD